MKRKSGRPPKEIDWNKVDQLLIAQNSGTEIAAQLGIHYDTLYDRVKRKYKQDFSEYSVALYSKGKSNLRTKQYQKAMEGNVQMLLRLGEIYLGQNSKTETTPPNSERIDNEHLQMENSELKRKVSVYESIHNKSETESKLCGSDTPL